MRLSALASGLCAFAALASASPRTAQVFIQPIESAANGGITSDKPSPLAEVAYDIAALSTSSIVSYEAPDLAPETRSVRIGIYDYKAKAWVSGTTVASVENFSKGYSPNIILSVDSRGDVVSAACKGVAIDAGQTRDFGPQAVVLPESRGKQPELNKPVVLSPEGKKVPEEQEKTFLQKYWWMIAIAIFVMVSGGGAEK
ncbi:hypothetical protein K4F52_001624 [Lecanicillium sp. MT-2017a]|nr:hypothetical protein K4F52_001624 [Lecanicillium sp. MT-2017a]